MPPGQPEIQALDPCGLLTAAWPGQFLAWRHLGCASKPKGSAFRRRGGLSCYTGRSIPRVRIRLDSPDETSDDTDALYEVRIIDNDFNTYGEVMHITMSALGISEEQAFAVAWEVDHAGFCVVAHAPCEEAQAIASVIRTIGIEVQVNPVVAETA